MFPSTSFFPHFFVRGCRASFKALALDTSCLNQLAVLFGKSIGLDLDAKTPENPKPRKRIFPTSVVFWAFLSQVLSPECSCREALRKVAALLKWKQNRVIDPETSGYCQARTRLPLSLLQEVGERAKSALERMTPMAGLWLGRVVKIIDGSTITTPDTQANQRRWPQPSSQKKGCGFPMIRLVGLFSLASGALLKMVADTYLTSENNLFRRLLQALEEGDVVLADRNFCSYSNLTALMARKVDTVMRMHQSRSPDFRKGKRLGKNQRLVTWKKPPRKPCLLSQEEFAALPAQITLRMLRLHIQAPGIRTRTLVLVCTLLDAKAYPPSALAELYRRRWGVELSFREIKITLKMDVLRCLSPAMIEKELAMHWIAYNFLRTLMLEASICYHVPLDRISFKGTADTLRQWIPVIAAVGIKRRSTFIATMLEAIASDQVPLRPNRREPRAVKRRPKAFQVLSKPRHYMRELPHRNHFYKKSAKTRSA
jgi:hypothetical protein